MGDIGVPELLIILAIAIILFGPARIGGVGKSLGEAIRGFRQAVRDDDVRTSTPKEQAAVEPSAPDDRVQADAPSYALDTPTQLQESASASE